MREHVVIGEHLVRQVPELADAAAAVRHHHERWDGTGYPDQLSGEAIPLPARIVAVVDAYSAMTSPRVYSKARSSFAAVAELERCSRVALRPAGRERVRPCPRAGRDHRLQCLTTSRRCPRSSCSTRSRAAASTRSRWPRRRWRASTGSSRASTRSSPSPPSAPAPMRSGPRRPGPTAPPARSAASRTRSKDLAVTKGIPTGRGSLVWGVDDAGFDAPVAERLAGAGGVLLGKTTTPEMGWKGDSGNRRNGPCHNPWRHGRTPGGSSGGTAAAAVGRLRAAAPGLRRRRLGAHPGELLRRRRPEADLRPVAQYPASAVETVSHVGPITRTVADCALMLDVMAGLDERDRTSVDPPCAVLPRCAVRAAGAAADRVQPRPRLRRRRARRRDPRRRGGRRAARTRAPRRGGRCSASTTRGGSRRPSGTRAWPPSTPTGSSEVRDLLDPGLRRRDRVGPAAIRRRGRPCLPGARRRGSTGCGSRWPATTCWSAPTLPCVGVRRRATTIPAPSPAGR